MAPRLISHAKATLLETAQQRSGQTDFGDDAWREGYDRLLDELDQAGLSPSGAEAAREFIIGNLAARLTAVAGFKANPVAMAMPIVRPLIITGIVRSGTTALHKLLAIDPQFQGAEHWICAAPQLRPPREQWVDIPAFLRARSALAAMAAISPEVIDDHGMAVDDVEESLNILAHCFRSNMYPSQFSIPEYDRWYRSAPDTASYRYLADVMRLIGAQEPDRTWLLKNPTDTFSLAEVLDVFPDAMVVQTHRDPLQAVPSIVNLIGGAHRMFRGDGNVDYARIFTREADFWAAAMERAQRTKSVQPDRVFDVEFTDFVGDQLGVVQAIYAYFGLVLSDATETHMRAWLAKNPRKAHSLQRFSAEDFGGNQTALSRQFEGYRLERSYI